MAQELLEHESMDGRRPGTRREPLRWAVHLEALAEVRAFLHRSE